MPDFFIIDHKRSMRLYLNTTAEKAKDLHDYSYAVKTDICVEAIPCPHPDRYIAPELPEWMDYYPSKGCNICLRCSTPIETKQGFSKEEETGFYNSKSTVIV